MLFLVDIVTQISDSEREQWRRTDRHEELSNYKHGIGPSHGRIRTRTITCGLGRRFGQIVKCRVLIVVAERCIRRHQRHQSRMRRSSGRCGRGRGRGGRGGSGRHAEIELAHVDGSVQRVYDGVVVVVANIGCAVQTAAVDGDHVVGREKIG